MRMRSKLLREGIPLPLIQRQLGHSHLSTTGTYLQGISSEEIISTVHARRAPMMHASAGLAPLEHNYAGAHDALPRPANRRSRAEIASRVSDSQPPLTLAWRSASGPRPSQASRAIVSCRRVLAGRQACS
jgi:hypothetical protein